MMSMPDETPTTATHWTIWPDHWAGGWGPHSTLPNRIRINDDAVGIVAFVEHHGNGTGNDKYPTDEDYKRAHLMKSAPELFAALKPFAEFFTDSLNDVGGGTRVAPSFPVQVFKDAMAAIAKAEGRTP